MMWRACLPFCTAAYVQIVYLLTITQNLCVCVKISDIIFQTLTETHLRTNIWLIILCYSDVKNLTSVLSCCLGPKCVSCNNDTKVLSLCDNCFAQIFLNRPINSLPTNKQLINHLCNFLKFNFQLVQWCQDCSYKERSTSIISWR